MTFGGHIVNFFFISFAKKKPNKQKERWLGHCNSCGQLQLAAVASFAPERSEGANDATRDKNELYA